jgi:hypothetical protein
MRPGEPPDHAGLFLFHDAVTSVIPESYSCHAGMLSTRPPALFANSTEINNAPSDNG